VVSRHLLASFPAGLLHHSFYHTEFKKYLKRGVLGDGEQPGCIEHDGRFDVARGRSSLSAACFLVSAAFCSDEQQVRSLGGALSAIIEQPFFGNLLSWYRGLRVGGLRPAHVRRRSLP